jgi:hypothetical protein
MKICFYIFTGATLLLFSCVDENTQKETNEVKESNKLSFVMLLDTILTFPLIIQVEQHGQEIGSASLQGIKSDTLSVFKCNFRLLENPIFQTNQIQFPYEDTTLTIIMRKSISEIQSNDTILSSVLKYKKTYLNDTINMIDLKHKSDSFHKMIEKDL